MAITMNTFTGQAITHKIDGMIRAAQIPDCILEGCAITRNGRTVTIAAGTLCIHGRLVTIDAAASVANMPISNTRSALVLTLNEADGTASLRGAAVQFLYPTTSITKEDINRNGSVYECVLAIYPVQDNTLGNVERTLGHAVPNGVIFGTAETPDSTDYPDGTLYIRYEA